MLSSRNRKTISGRFIVKKEPKIKPTVARRVIRRFHFLIGKRQIICSRLGVVLVSSDEEANKGCIETWVRNSKLQEKYDRGMKTQSQQLEKHLLKLRDISNTGVLVELLGYLMNEIYTKGGLKNYQMASTVGQDRNRGGDSSKVLIPWLRELGLKSQRDHGCDRGNPRRALEIGSLSSKNAISTCGIFDPVVRIDLNSTGEGISKQDFMDRPLPKHESERFDLISCSLVLNFVPTPQLRGEMLKRFSHFLKRGTDQAFLFVVLPRPCIDNSRHMSDQWFSEMMESLNYKKLRRHVTHKIIYYLFAVATRLPPKHIGGKFKLKPVVKDAAGMNNFAILL
ncbi:LAMI_0C06986g1_1 [Lachancea mirantina]|uniref:25S rRNA adenine-N(1) methyltransferase n=1 Tax=Lachancea mirantina TaxID=1230905 RepID=A0A1G4J3W9_9SACH|nr:LAMI_0C06986g1_1 [Lachancea mirantina]